MTESRDRQIDGLRERFLIHPTHESPRVPGNCVIFSWRGGRRTEGMRPQPGCRETASGARLGRISQNQHSRFERSHHSPGYSFLEAELRKIDCLRAIWLLRLVEFILNFPFSFSPRCAFLGELFCSKGMRDIGFIADVSALHRSRFSAAVRRRAGGWWLEAQP